MIATTAIARLQLPAGPVQVGPPPQINEWNMAVVGYPLWLWTDDQHQLTESVTEQGLTVTLTATAQETVFTLGDGETVTCEDTTPWTRRVATEAPSPTCGYTYQQPSIRPDGKLGHYNLTATTTWQVHWTGGGQSGTETLQLTSPTTELPVGELHALITN